MRPTPARLNEIQELTYVPSKFADADTTRRALHDLYLELDALRAELTALKDTAIQRALANPSAPASSDPRTS
jgi:hypothetical protein